MPGAEHAPNLEYLLNHSEWSPRPVEGYDVLDPEQLDILPREGLWLPEDPGSIVLRSPSDPTPDHFRTVDHFEGHFLHRRLDNQYLIGDVLDNLTHRLELVAAQNPDSPLFLKPTIYINQHMSEARRNGLAERLKLYWPMYEEEMARVMLAQLLRAYEIEERIQDGEEKTEMPVAASITERNGSPTFSGIHVSRDIELGNYTKHAEDILSEAQLRIDLNLGEDRMNHRGRNLFVGQTCCQMCTTMVINGKFDMVLFGSENDELDVQQLYNGSGRGKLTMLPLMKMFAENEYGPQNIPVMINMGQIGMHAAVHVALGERDAEHDVQSLKDDAPSVQRPERISEKFE